MELVLFGKGVGECILFHTGDFEWIVIDCCKNPNTSEPAPISYLKGIGVVPEERIKKIIVSHFHSDHIEGMKDLISICSAATVYIPDALSINEACQLFAHQDVGQVHFDHELGSKEFIKVIKHLNQTGKYKTLKADILIHENSQTNEQVFSLSPSEGDCRNLREKFQILLHSVSEQNIPAITKDMSNHNCIAVNISSKFTENSNNDVLLGADLEVTKSNNNSGWDAVLSSQKVPNNSASIFKIPHHGSVTGFHYDIWKKCFFGKPLGILTTFNRGRKKLPEEEYIRKYASLTSSLYSATKPDYFNKIKQSKNDKAIEKLLSKTKSTITRSQRKSKGFGFIEISQNSSGINVELKGDAACIKTLLAS